MSRFLIYTHLRIKAVLKIFPSMCVMTLLLCLALGGMIYLQSASSLQIAEGDEDATVSIGIAGISDEGTFSAAFPMLLKMDSSRSEVNFVLYDTKQEAIRAIRSKKILAAVVIPDGVVQTLLSGGLDQMTLIVPASSAGIEALLMRELSITISVILGSMNSASHILADYYNVSGTTDPDIIANAQTDLLLTGMQDMLHRSHMFKVKYTKSEKQLSVESFYLVSMVLLLILLIGVMCAGSFIRSDYSLPKLLRLRKLGPAKQMCAEYISLVVLLVCLCAVFIPLIGAALSHMPITFSAFGLTPKIFFRRFLLFGLKTFPVILLAAGIDLFLYELSRSLITGVLLQFLTMISLAYLSGIFYTVSTMPEALKTIQKILPVGQALLYLQHVAKNKGFAPQYLVIVLLWSLVFLCLACIVRSFNMSRKRGAK